MTSELPKEAPAAEVLLGRDDRKRTCTLSTTPLPGNLERLCGRKSDTHRSSLVGIDTPQRDDTKKRTSRCAKTSHASLREKRGEHVVTEPVINSEGPRHEIFGVVDVLFDTLKCFGLRSPTTRTADGKRLVASKEKTLAHWCAGAKACGDDGWMKFAKYKFAAFFFYHTQQSDPEGPSPPWSGDFHDLPQKLAGGVAGQFISKVLLRGALRDSFLATVLQIKKGCPRPSKPMVEKQVNKTYDALTSEQKSIDQDALFVGGNDHHHSGKTTRVVLEEELKRTVQEIFGPRRSKGKMIPGPAYTDKERFKPSFPSTSACYDVSRGKGGSVEAIRRFLHCNGYQEHFRQELDGECTEGVKTLFKIVTCEEYIGAPRFMMVVDSSFVEAQYSDAYGKIMAAAVEEDPLCRPVGLAESLKVRVITKGPAYTGFVLKPLQKFLWRTLKNHPTFKLIGQPVSAAIVQKMMGELREDQLLMSGDYSAATDKLAPWVSDCIADEISKVLNLFPEEALLFKRALTQHVMCHDDGRRLPQRWGQLMGSVVSFPILCIANAAMTRLSLEVEDAKQQWLSKCPIIINGDDVLAKMTFAEYEIWKRVTAFVGLETSVGKTFASREFAQINSENFRYENGIYIATEFVNLGLLFGLKRSGEKIGLDAIADDAMDGTIGFRHHDLMLKCPQSLRESVHKLFLKKHHDMLVQVRVPWYMPESWGGVGLRPLVTETDIFRDGGEDGDVRSSLAPFLRYGPTKVDLQLAHKIYDSPEAFPVGRVKGKMSWLTHKLVLAHEVATEQLPDYLTPIQDRFRGNYDHWYGSQAFLTLCGKETMYDSRTKGSVMTLRTNEKLWAKAHSLTNWAQPLTREFVFARSPSPIYHTIYKDDFHAPLDYRRLPYHHSLRRMVESRTDSVMEFEEGFEPRRENMQKFEDDLWR